MPPISSRTIDPDMYGYNFGVPVTMPNGGGSSGSVWADTEGRANELRHDPHMDAAMQYLQSVMGGQNLPYNEQNMGAMRAQNAHGTAAAEAAQMAMLRDTVGAGGGSIYDPSYQATSREMMSQRQGRNLDYNGQLQAQAGQANYNARTQASQGLANMSLANNAQINALLGQGAGYRAQEFTDSPESPRGGSGSDILTPPAYTPYSQAWSGAAQSAPLTSYQQQPQTSGAPAPQAPATGNATGYSGATPQPWRYVQEGTPQAGTPDYYGTAAKPMAPAPTTAPTAMKPMTTYSTRRTA